MSDAWETGRGQVNAQSIRRMRRACIFISQKESKESMRAQIQTLRENIGRENWIWPAQVAAIYFCLPSITEIIIFWRFEGDAL